jgi:hypothetical protein
MHPMRTLSSMCLLSLVACGGSSTAPNSGSNSCTASLSATVNGVVWCSPAGAGTFQHSIVSIAGIDAGLVSSIAFAFVATVPGTYSLGSGNINAGFATYTRNGQGWGSALSGGTGSVTLTTLTATHAAGTFTFDAVPSNGGATGTILVTNGTFNITF